MATLARFDASPEPRDNAGYARRRRADPKGLEAFRVLADVDYERSLTTLIEREIIPRLMIAHAADTPRIVNAEIDAAEIDALAPMALEADTDALLAQVEAVLARGVGVDTVMVDLLAPTARLLGEYWEADRCDFVDVTMALWRLQEVVHEIAARLPVVRRRAAGGYRALFASMPGDDHDFGTVVVDELFRGDGWVTDRMSGVATADLLKRVGHDWFDVVGLTVSCDDHMGPLPSIIVALRNVSKNPRLCVMVGGRVFSAAPELATAVGADGTARDAKLALTVAAELVRAREAECLVSS